MQIGGDKTQERQIGYVWNQWFCCLLAVVKPGGLPWANGLEDRRTKSVGLPDLESLRGFRQGSSSSAPKARCNRVYQCGGGVCRLGLLVLAHLPSFHHRLGWINQIGQQGLPGLYDKIPLCALDAFLLSHVNERYTIGSDVTNRGGNKLSFWGMVGYCAFWYSYPLFFYIVLRLFFHDLARYSFTMF